MKNVLKLFGYGIAIGAGYELGIDAVVYLKKKMKSYEIVEKKAES